MPHTLVALRTGRTTEWRATLMARETACVSLEDRMEVDRRIASDADAFEAMGDRDIVDRARALACELDPASVAENRRWAEADRHTTLGPAPDTVLLGDTDGVGWVEEHGDVPGDLLREWIADHAEQGTKDWVKRLYARPDTGQLVAMDKHGRRFDGALAEFLRLRDRRCATRWCDAPVRHLDHIKPVDQGGPTSADNAQGLCEPCNHAKQAQGWTARPRPGPRRSIETTTPTGHVYASGNRSHVVRVSTA